MRKHVNNGTLFLLFAAVTGCCIGVFIWLFLFIANYGITILWQWIPDSISFSYYTIVMCLAGGLLIGIFHKVFGQWPDSMSEAVKRVRNERTYPYQKIPIIVIAAYLSLFFGGSVGPEAALVGLILALCFWDMAQFGFARNRMERIIRQNPDIHRGRLFSMMVRGIFLPPRKLVYEKEFQWKKSEQISAGVVSGICGLVLYLVLNRYVASGITIPHLSSSAVTGIDKLILVILIVAGIAAGYLYMIFKKITGKVFGYLAGKGLHILNAVLGGAVLGIVGTFLPMTMFSGGNEMQAMQYQYLEMTPVLLIVIGVVKLFLTNVCIESGWRGGHFFPLIFSGLSIGYGMSILLGTNQVLCVVVVSTALLATVLQQPIGALVLSLLFFPIEHMGWMCAAAFAGGCIPLPKALRVDPDNKGFIYNTTHYVYQKKLTQKENKQ